MTRFFKLIFFCFIVQTLSSQDISLPAEAQDGYVYFKDSQGYPSLLTFKGVYKFSSKWKFRQLEIDSSDRAFSDLKKTYNLSNETLTPLALKNNTLFILNGGGYVFKLNENKLSKIDNSVIQKNQFNSATFYFDNQVYMHGGYGFWSFKNYTTFLDNDTGQWEMVYPKQNFQPVGRWKMISALVEDRLYVLGGRGNFPEKQNKDVELDTYYFFDLNSKIYADLGVFNQDLPLKTNIKSNFTIQNKKVFLEPGRAIVYDFKNNVAHIHKNQNFFSGINLNRPVIEINDTLFYIKTINDRDYLAKTSIKSIYESDPQELIISSPKQSPSLNFFGFIILAVFCWVAYKLFVFKDFLKGLVLYDETKIYYEDKSSLMNPKQIQVIKALESKGQLSSKSLNEIISDKKFVKSHFTVLRNEFISEINTMYKNVTSTHSDLIEEAPDPNDKRYKIYKTTQQVTEKESFFSFLFRL